MIKIQNWRIVSWPKKAATKNTQKTCFTNFKSCKV